MSWFKATAAVSAVILGVTASFTAMLPTSHRTEAAIAVIEKKNIEEAIKTAIQTAKILNTKKLDVSML